MSLARIPSKMAILAIVALYFAVSGNLTDLCAIGARAPV